MQFKNNHISIILKTVPVLFFSDPFQMSFKRLNQFIKDLNAL